MINSVLKQSPSTVTPLIKPHQRHQPPPPVVTCTPRIRAGNDAAHLVRSVPYSNIRCCLTYDDKRQPTTEWAEDLVEALIEALRPSISYVMHAIHTVP
ncbi:hypothetical protein WOLCODRAFT_135538 [Wolfiporia cocos MD-104 SS10]|uniref:Uncharacterized protein n=1 Tax=Wolfiporia cocos (strain MD-104) TaxID=742152 RepID=A0A2H3IW03_WOLCO|nr:hypothetical protein WOLCODRAFT_135538 [Wolfiporia cocos MD-104 SS10]